MLHNQEGENTGSQIIKLLKTNPMVMFSDAIIEKIASDLLPFSTGIEIECDQKSSYNRQAFVDINGMMEVNVDSSEQRYRIVPGFDGLKCLYQLCENLKEYSLFNSGSGIHFHIDMIDCFHNVTKQTVNDNKDWILAELDSWGYRYDYNPRDVAINQRKWVNLQTEFKTAEFRICEMSFDYQFLLKRIMHCQQIVKVFKSKIQFGGEIEMLMKEIEDNAVEPDLDHDFVNEVVKSRKIRI